MANVYGKPGGYAKSQYTSKFLRNMIVPLVVLALFEAAIGYCMGSSHSGGIATLYSLGGLVALVLLLLFLSPRIEHFLDRRASEALNWKAGYTGEALVANRLDDLPEDYYVFHDVKHRDLAGNIDHLVVGPTGVFVLETKNWRGHVEYSLDKKLLCDGHDKTSEVNTLLQRVFSVRNKIKALSGLDVFVVGVMVFTRASVTPNFEATVPLQQDDFLMDKCLLWPDKSRKLSQDKVAAVAADLRALFRREL